jgi:hypothetical protein
MSLSKAGIITDFIIKKKTEQDLPEESTSAGKNKIQAVEPENSSAMVPLLIMLITFAAGLVLIIYKVFISH